MQQVTQENRSVNQILDASNAVANSIILIKRIGVDKRTREYQATESFRETLISNRIPNSPRLEPRRKPELW